MHNSHNKVRNLQLNMLYYHASNNSGVDFHFASNVTVMCFVLAGVNRTVIRNSSDRPTYWRLFILSTILQTNRPSCNICHNVSLYHRKDQTVLSNRKVLASIIWRRWTSHSADMWQKEIDKVICLSVNFHSSVNSACSSNDIYLSYKDNLQSCQINKCSAATEMGDHLATTYMSRKLGGTVPLLGVSWVPI